MNLQGNSKVSRIAEYHKISTSNNYQKSNAEVASGRLPLPVSVFILPFTEYWKGKVMVGQNTHCFIPLVLSSAHLTVSVSLIGSYKYVDWPTLTKLSTCQLMRQKNWCYHIFSTINTESTISSKYIPIYFISKSVSLVKNI